MQILENQEDIAVAEATFINAILGSGSEVIPVTIGFQSGSTDAEVHWFPSLGIWAFFGEPPFEKWPGDRYWNVFGIGRPAGMVNIVCEINPPRRGLNRQAAGAFVREPSGIVTVIHRGILNARGRIPFEFTRQGFQWRWITVLDGDRQASVMPVARLDSPEVGASVRDFALEVQRFKDTARSRPWIG